VTSNASHAAMAAFPPKPAQRQTIEYPIEKRRFGDTDGMAALHSIAQEPANLRYRGYVPEVAVMWCTGSDQTGFSVTHPAKSG
jgi:hypothetical protein